MNYSTSMFRYLSFWFCEYIFYLTYILVCLSYNISYMTYIQIKILKVIEVNKQVREVK